MTLLLLLVSGHSNRWCTVAEVICSLVIKFFNFEGVPSRTWAVGRVPPMFVARLGGDLDHG